MPSRAEENRRTVTFIDETNIRNDAELLKLKTLLPASRVVASWPNANKNNHVCTPPGWRCSVSLATTFVSCNAFPAFLCATTVAALLWVHVTRGVFSHNIFLFGRNVQRR